jgi:hypothetical protein
MTHRQLCLNKLVSGWINKRPKILQNIALFFPQISTKGISIEMEKMNLPRSKIDLKKIVGFYELIFLKEDK